MCTSVHNCKYHCRVDARKNSFGLKVRTFMFLINDPKLPSKKTACDQLPEGTYFSTLPPTLVIANDVHFFQF